MTLTARVQNGPGEQVLANGGSSTAVPMAYGNGRNPFGDGRWCVRATHRFRARSAHHIRQLLVGIVEDDGHGAAVCPTAGVLLQPH
jgi:hypothetical protein